MNKVLYYYGSGHLDNLYTGVDGGSLIRLPLFEELVNRGWKIKWLGHEYKDRKCTPILDIFNIREKDYTYSVRHLVEDIGPNYTDEDLQEDGILFIELRPFESKPGYNFVNESKTQMDLINKFYDKKRLILLQDQDGWYKQIPDEYAKKCFLLRAYERDIDDNRFIGSAKYIWAWKDFSNIFNLNRPKIFDTMYCGNVYERRNFFLEFFKPLHDTNHKIAVAGNWLRKKYDDRDFSLDNFPNNIWLGQTEHWTTLPLINSSKFVIHTSNKRQQDLGIICIRVFEALMGQVPLFVNKDIYGIENYVCEEQIVSSGAELYDRIHNVDLDEIYNKFKLKMANYTIDKHVDRLEAIIKKTI
jgi:hypothetical protein